MKLVRKNTEELLFNSTFREVALQDISAYLQDAETRHIVTDSGFKIMLSSAISEGDVVDTGNGTLICNPKNYLQVKQHLEDTLQKLRQDDKDAIIEYISKIPVAKIFSLVEWLENK